MGNYILKRTLLIIPTMFLVSIIVFLFQRFIPGSAVDVIEAQFIAMGQTDIDRAAIIHQLGLDVPILQQYINWIGGIITRGDFGTSMLQNKPVLDLIASRVGPTLELGLYECNFLPICSAFPWASTLPPGRESWLILCSAPCPSCSFPSPASGLQPW